MDEKQSAAQTSLFAALALTSLKAIVGIATQSLGILAEAAHSGLDLIAALMTFLAIRIAGRPADRNHLYGHGKVENLSAVLEAGLLLVTCAWIIYEAARRLWFQKVDVNVTFWSFAVIGASIVIDLSRSRVLYRVAKRCRSQALEADALHFRSDVWSSGVVLLGLLCVKISQRFPTLNWLEQADAVAATGVALIVIVVSWKLGVRTVLALLDTAPEGMEQNIIRAVEALPGVANCHNVRMRYSGPLLFVDVHVLMDGNQTLKQAHDITEEIERTIQALSPGADVTVHPEPAESL